MSWTRKLFGQGGQITSVVTSFPTNTTTNFNTNTSQITSWLTSRLTSTVWGLNANTSTTFQTSRITDGAASRNTTTTWLVYGSGVSTSYPAYSRNTAECSVSYVTTYNTPYSNTSRTTSRTTSSGPVPDSITRTDFQTCYNTFVTNYAQTCWNTNVNTTCTTISCVVDANTTFTTSSYNQPVSGCRYFNCDGSVASEDSPSPGCSLVSCGPPTPSYQNCLVTEPVYNTECGSPGYYYGAYCVDAETWASLCQIPNQPDSNCSTTSCCADYVVNTTNTSYYTSVLASNCYDCIESCIDINTTVDYNTTCTTSTYPCVAPRNTCSSYPSGGSTRNTCHITSTYVTSYISYNYTTSWTTNWNTAGTPVPGVVTPVTSCHNTTTQWIITTYNTYVVTGSDSRNTTTTWGGTYSTYWNTTSTFNTVNTQSRNTSTQWNTSDTTTWLTNTSQITNTNTSRTTSWITE